TSGCPSDWPRLGVALRCHCIRSWVDETPVDERNGPSQANATRARSYLLTLGLALSSIPLLLGFPTGETTWIWIDWLPRAGFLLGGIGLMLWGLGACAAETIKAKT